jgi:hypothetical protein
MLPLITDTPMCEIQPISKHPIITNTPMCEIQPIFPKLQFITYCKVSLLNDN